MRCWPIPMSRQSVSWARRVGGHVYRSATSQLKRAQCFVGAKNHMVIMPDANKAQVLATWWEPGSAPPVSAAWPSAWRCSWAAPGVDPRARRRVRQGETRRLARS
jgi:hypothetical protein